MDRRPRPVLVMTLAMLLAAVATRADDDVAARVNGTPISTTLVREVVRGVIKDKRTPPGSDEIATLNEAALESLIDLELLYQEAQRRGLTVSDAEVTAEIQRTRARFRDAKQYDAALAQSGLSEATLRADTRKTLLVNRLLTDVVWKDIQITPEDAHEFYDDNRTAFVRNGKPLSYDEAQATVMHILRDDQQRRRQAAFAAQLRGAARIEKPTAKPD